MSEKGEDTPEDAPLLPLHQSRTSPGQGLRGGQTSGRGIGSTGGGGSATPDSYLGGLGSGRAGGTLPPPHTAPAAIPGGWGSLHPFAVQNLFLFLSPTPPSPPSDMVAFRAGSRGTRLLAEREFFCNTPLLQRLLERSGDVFIPRRCVATLPPPTGWESPVFALAVAGDTVFSLHGAAESEVNGIVVSVRGGARQAEIHRWRSPAWERDSSIVIEDLAATSLVILGTHLVASGVSGFDAWDVQTLQKEHSWRNRPGTAAHGQAPSFEGTGAMALTRSGMFLWGAQGYDGNRRTSTDGFIYVWNTATNPSGGWRHEATTSCEIVVHRDDYQDARRAWPRHWEICSPVRGKGMARRAPPLRGKGVASLLVCEDQWEDTSMPITAKVRELDALASAKKETYITDILMNALGLSRAAADAKAAEAFCKELGSLIPAEKAYVVPFNAARARAGGAGGASGAGGAGGAALEEGSSAQEAEEGKDRSTSEEGKERPWREQVISVHRGCILFWDPETWECRKYMMTGDPSSGVRLVGAARGESISAIVLPAPAVPIESGMGLRNLSPPMLLLAHRRYQNMNTFDVRVLNMSTWEVEHDRGRGKQGGIPPSIPQPIVRRPVGDGSIWAQERGKHQYEADDSDSRHVLVLHGDTLLAGHGRGINAFNTRTWRCEGRVELPSNILVEAQSSLDLETALAKGAGSRSNGQSVSAVAVCGNLVVSGSTVGELNLFASDNWWDTVHSLRRRPQGEVVEEGGVLPGAGANNDGGSYHEGRGEGTMDAGRWHRGSGAHIPRSLSRPGRGLGPSCRRLWDCVHGLISRGSRFTTHQPSYREPGCGSCFYWFGSCLYAEERREPIL